MSSYKIGIFTGFIISLVCIFIMSSKNKCKNEYDERQMMIRGRGYSYAFYVILLLEMLYSIFQEDFPMIIPPGIIMIIILFTSGTVLITYLIFNDAYWGYRYHKFKTYVIFYIVMFITNLIQVFNAISNNRMFENGILQFNGGLQLIVAIFCLYMAVILSIKTFIDKKNRDAE